MSLLRCTKERKFVGKKNWKDIILDTKERKVFEALADFRHVYRTIDGIARSSKLSTNEVREIIIKNFSLIRKYPFPDKKGRELYTLQKNQKAQRRP
jgi:hypothetical protein